MSVDRLESVLLSVANCDHAMAALPEDVRASVLSVKGEVEMRVKEREADERKREIERRETDEKAEKARHAELAKYLCKGTWSERVPLSRRFAMCETIGKKFVGFYGQEKDPSKWEDCKQVCSVDLIRGFMGPYWGYYDYIGIDEAFKRTVKPILEACDDFDRMMRIRSEFDFFHVTNHGNAPFRILTYEVGPGEHVRVIGRGEMKTWEQHRAALKAEFAQDGDADPE